MSLRRKSADRAGIAILSCGWRPDLLRIAACTTSVSAALLLTAAQPAFGAVLGDVELRSSLGQPLRAWIPYRPGHGERIDPACVRVSQATSSGAAGLPSLMNVRPRLQSEGGKDFIIIESAVPVNELVVPLIVELGCDRSVRTTREYVLLPEPLKSGAASPRPSRNTGGAPTRPSRQPDREPAVLPVAPAPVHEDVEALPARKACCMRLAYELTDRGPPPSEAQRERLRQELREPADRLQAVNDKADALQRRLDSTVKRLENSEARIGQDARLVREIKLYGTSAAILLVLGLGAWTAWRLKRRAMLDGPVAAARPAIPVLTSPETLPPGPVAGMKGRNSRTQVDFDVSRTDRDTQSMPVVNLPGHIAAPLDPALRAAEYKKAYILGRFPEIAAGNIVLDDPASVIEAARIIYQDDHNPAKAVELLHVAIANDSGQLRLWLALFEILSTESMAQEFASVAQRYRDTRDVRADSYWPMIAKMGRDLQPGNALYRVEGVPLVEGAHPNWLNSQLDMMGDVLAIELRMQVLEQRKTPN